MSIDIADDLQAAEEDAETVRLAARKVVEAWDVWDDTDGPKSESPESQAMFSTFADAIRDLDDVTAQRLVRPTCQADQCEWTADGTERLCGGYHPAEEEP